MKDDLDTARGIILGVVTMIAAFSWCLVIILLAR